MLIASRSIIGINAPRGPLFCTSNYYTLYSNYVYRAGLHWMPRGDSLLDYRSENFGERTFGDGLRPEASGRTARIPPTFAAAPEGTKLYIFSSGWLQTSESKERRSRQAPS